MQGAKFVEVPAGPAPIRFETGLLAKQAHGAVYATQGDTAVLVAVVIGPPRKGEEDRDFLPLTVEYRERTYAVGRFPGGFMKRDGRPGKLETIVAREIDRPIRPLFPWGFFNELQVHSTTVSYDGINDPGILASNAASAALVLSGAPFQGPVSTVRVGLIDDQFVLNPSLEDQARSKLHLVVSGTKDGIIMVEAGAHELTEDQLLEAIRFAEGPLREINEAQSRLREMHPPEAKSWEIKSYPEAVFGEMKKKFAAEAEKALFIQKKQDRYTAVAELNAKIENHFCPKDAKGAPLKDEPKPADVKRAYAALVEEITRNAALTGRRSDGRGPKDIRPITIQLGVLPRSHGSAVFTRGETQALISATLGTSDDAQIVDGIRPEFTERFMLHYNFPSFSTGEVKPIRGPGRREIGHGALAERAIEPVIPGVEAFPYTVRIVSEILESNGSSSMASVCGGTLALMDAGVHITAPVAGIAMGLVKEGNRHIVLSDILGSEDALGDMDFKVAGTEKGITALQMDLKRPGISPEVMREALGQAREGRLHILAKMHEAIQTPRAELSPYAPKVEKCKIPVDKIGLLIGPGGKNVREIQERTGTDITIEENGDVFIYGRQADGVRQAKEMVDGMTFEPEVGKIYNCRVESMKDFGVFVAIIPSGVEGLLHISEIADGYVERVDDYLVEGQELKCKLIEVDDFGKKRFSLKQAARELGFTVERNPNAPPPSERPPREDRGPRGGGGGRDRFRSSRPGGGGGDRGPREGGGGGGGPRRFGDRR